MSQFILHKKRLFTHIDYNLLVLQSHDLNVNASSIHYQDHPNLENRLYPYKKLMEFPTAINPKSESDTISRKVARIGL